MRTLTVLLSALLLGAVAGADVVKPGTSEQRVDVRDVGLADGMLSGVLVNRTDDEVSNVRLLASDRFLWKDEQHPGPNDPSRGLAFTVPGPLAPGASLPFSQPMPPRPPRSDGRFVLEVSVVGLEQQPLLP